MTEYQKYKHYRLLANQHYAQAQTKIDSIKSKMDEPMRKRIDWTRTIPEIAHQVYYKSFSFYFQGQAYLAGDEYGKYLKYKIESDRIAKNLPQLRVINNETLGIRQIRRNLRDWDKKQKRLQDYRKSRIKKPTK